jgi:hypothetical protein
MAFARVSRRGKLAWLFVATRLLVPVDSAAASCQTVYCHQLYSRSDVGREAELATRVAADPGAVESWRELLRLIEHKPRRMAFLSRYDALYQWEPSADLELDPAERLRREREAWLAAWKMAMPESGEPWCEEARQEVDGAARVEILRRGADILPDDSRVRSCLAESLAAAGETAEGLAVMEELRDRRPDDEAVWDELVASLRRGDQPEALRAALEERARRFPADRDATRELLAFYDDRGLTAPRDQLLAEIAAGGDLETPVRRPWSRTSQPRQGSQTRSVRCSPAPATAC